MPYLTATDLMAATSEQELAQAASPRASAPVSAQVMRMAILEQDLSGEPDAAKAALALARIQTLIVSATDLVDNFLRVRYPVPLAETPSTVREIMARVVRYLLHDQRATEEIRARYKEALGWLEAIAAGTMQLGVGPGVVVDHGGPAYEGGSSLYSVCGLHGFARGYP